MATITATISKKKDIKTLTELLDRMGIQYIVDESAEDYEFSTEQIADLERTQQDYLAGKTTARDWEDIKQNLKYAIFKYN